eukprot:748195-Hanusia_phi.AAC.5
MNSRCVCSQAGSLAYQEVDAKLQRLVEGSERDFLMLVVVDVVEGGHAHATQPHGRDHQSLRTEWAKLHAEEDVARRWAAPYGSSLSRTTVFTII